MIAASFTLRLLRLLRRLLMLGHREMTRHPAACLVHAWRSAVNDRASGIEVNGETSAVHLVLIAHKLDVANQGDQLAVQVIDPEVSLGRFRGAVHDHSAGCVEA